MRSITAVLLACILAGTACSAGDSMQSTPPAVDHDAQGSWGQNNGGAVIPGSSFVMALSESSGAITGSGSFAGEAAPYGSLSVSGAVANDSLHLRIIYVYEPHVFPQLQPDTATFVGRLTNRDQIDGMLTRGGVASPFGLVRLRASDPY